MKKKLIYLFLPLMLLLLVPFAGCGDDTSDIRATAEGFMGALQAGDMDKMKEYADPALFEAGGDLEDLAQIDGLYAQFAQAVGMQESDLTETTKESLQNFVDTMMENLVTSYEILDVTQEGEAGKVKVKTVYGYDPNKVQDIDLSDEVATLASEYTSEHMTELTEIYQKEGQTAMMNKLLDDMMADILDKYTEKMMTTGEVTENSVLIIENRDGKWLVTGDRQTT